MAFASEVLYAPIVASAAGDNSLVAAVAGKKIRVLSLFLAASGGANNVRFKSGSTGLTGVMNLPANGQLPLPKADGAGWFETAVNTVLNLELSAATAVGGMLVYVLVE